MNLDLFASKVSSRRALLKTYWQGLSLTGDAHTAGAGQPLG